MNEIELKKRYISRRTQDLINIIKNPKFKEKFWSILGEGYWHRLASDISYHESGINIKLFSSHSANSLLTLSSYKVVI